MTADPVVLIINRTDSKCGACGRGADPYAKSHDKVIGYKPGPGCGATWTHVTSSYRGGGIEEATLEMRPDLDWFDGVVI